MKFYQYIYSLLLITGLASCNKFLDVSPKNSVSDATTIVDKSSAETAVRGMYNSLASGSYYGTSFQSIGYLSGDNIARTGPSTDPSQFIDHNVTADNGTINSVWNAIYNTINRANHVIAKVPAVDDIRLTQELKNQLLGEAYFVRALAYFDLARTWGGVQIVLEPTQSVQDKIGVKRSTLAQTYAQVLKDLETAEPLLPPTLNRVRATKNTVWALRARYHLYQKEWAQAESYADKIINMTNNYKLISPYNSFWANNVVATQESIFELSYSAATPNSHRGSWQPPEKGGTRVWIPNNAFITLVSDSTIGGSRNTLIARTTGGLWYGNMYYRSPATDPTFILRIAELILIRAEARIQQDKIEEALSDLNIVRKRAGLTNKTGLSKDETLLAIENERRVEFAYEPHRWFDLIRTGRATTVLSITNPNKLLMPIPISQINADKATEQNPGY
ncbi:RagB/SusD family nutrient uptake outer membrane protein [Emticicia sp. BO119]|uniref:RagB/SusD family nutrient uptake outer membrane protein n=1 Tax=Emticicia sp. BO119 TaxID=2757768 RepID=UPI0015F0CFFA|nr:RagB/SusD family nutrient uptake outer membrane protein [Emticicia sp. BO119]MBA4850570.1 RagB/SusD family nutrient uptake outer membrane protein [Emticicia sp. BO119]